MGIFNGIEMLFFFLGVITTCGVFGLIHLKQKINAGLPGMALSLIGFMLLVFNIAWSMSSILEKEHQAANMGMIFFGLPAVLFIGLAWKTVLRENAKTLPVSEDE